MEPGGKTTEPGGNRVPGITTVPEGKIVPAGTPEAGIGVLKEIT
jgi:hypothetical protein